MKTSVVTVGGMLSAATPMSIMVATVEGATIGLLFKNAEASRGVRLGAHV